MTKENQTTDASKTELTDDELDKAEGGAAYVKFDGVDGESKDTTPSAGLSLNFAKVEVNHRELESNSRDKLSWKVKR